MIPTHLQKPSTPPRQHLTSLDLPTLKSLPGVNGRHGAFLAEVVEVILSSRPGRGPAMERNAMELERKADPIDYYLAVGFINIIISFFFFKTSNEDYFLDQKQSEKF